MSEIETMSMNEVMTFDQQALGGDPNGARIVCECSGELFILLSGGLIICDKCEEIVSRRSLPMFDNG